MDALSLDQLKEELARIFPDGAYQGALHPLLENPIATGKRLGCWGGAHLSNRTAEGRSIRLPAIAIVETCQQRVKFIFYF
jgi:hypothetical protein